MWYLHLPPPPIKYLYATLYIFMYYSGSYALMDGVLPLYRILNSVRLAKAKYVIWSQDMSHVAILGRNGERMDTHHLACVICAPHADIQYMYILGVVDVYP